MKTLRALTATFLCILLPSSPVLAQAPEQDSEIIIMPGGNLLNWHGHAGRTYFIQSSDPNDHLKEWIWSDLIEYGNNEAISHEVGTTADKAFFRLHYTDTQPPAGVTLEQWDADGDGLSNELELDLQSNPLNVDTNSDGIPDGWAHAHGYYPNANIASSPFQGGTVTNLEAFQQGVQADPNATIDDHDADGVNNEADADPQDSDVDWKPALVGGYALIEIDVPVEAGQVRDFNDAGHVLFDKGVWNAGAWTALEQVEVDGSFEVEPFEFNYTSTSNYGWKLSPAGDLLEMGIFDVNGPGDTLEMSHVLRRGYQPQTTSYQSAVSTLHTLDWQGEGYEWLSLRVLGEDDNHRIFTSKWVDTVSPEQSEPEIWILNSNLVQTGAYQVPAGYSLYLHGNQVTPTGWLAVNANPTTGNNEARTIVWNPAGQEISTSGGLPWFSTGLTELPHGKPALSCRHHGSNGLVYLLNENGVAFKTADKLGGKRIHTFAGDGTAITSDNKMWINGEFVPLRDICPLYGDLLDAGWTFQLHKANKHGNYLVEAHKDGESKPHILLNIAALVPNLDAAGEEIENEYIGATELKVAKWENAFDGNDFHANLKDNFIEWDKDRFQIIVLGGANMGVEAVKIASENCPDEDYNDDPTHIDLMIEGKDAVTDSMILVSDDEDDDYAGSGAGADDQDGDRTHKIQLDGDLVVKSITINGIEHSVNVKFAVPAKKQVDINFYKFDFANAASEQSIRDAITWVKERYAQVGLKINDGYDEINWPDISGTEGEGKMSIYNNYSQNQSLQQVYFDFIDNVPNSGICVYNVIYAYASSGIAVTLSQIAFEEEIELMYLNKAFVHSFATGESNTQTTAHEILHVLAPKVVGDDHDEHFSNILVEPAVNPNADHRGRKRINSAQQERIYNHLYVEDI